MLAPVFKERYLHPNIPAASLETVEGGAVLTCHTAVVGKVDRQTPILVEGPSGEVQSVLDGAQEHHRERPRA